MQYLPHELPNDFLLTSVFGGVNFDIHEAATYLGATPNTIRRWQRSGKFPPWARHLLLIKYRGLPLAGEWKQFSIQNGTLYTPYKRFTFTPRKLLATWYLINNAKPDDPNFQLFLSAANGKLYGKRELA